MKFYKRVLAVVVAFAYICILSSCSSNNAKKSDNKIASQTKSEDTINSSIISDKSNSDYQYSDEESDNDELSDGDISEVKVEFDKTATIDNTLLFDQNNIKISATELEYSDWNVKLNVLIENNSSEMVTIYSGCGGYSATSINKYHIPEGYLVCDIPSGTKKIEDVSFSFSNLQPLGINGISEIDYGFRVDTSDNEDKYKNKATLFQGTKNIRTSQYEKYKDDNPSIQNLSELSYVTTKKTFSDSFSSSEKYSVPQIIYATRDGEDYIFIEVQNNSNDMVNFLIKDITLNGIIAYGGRYGDTVDTLPGGKCYFYFSLDSLMDTIREKVFNIQDIQSVGFTIQGIAEDYETELIPEDEFEFNISNKEIGKDYFEGAIYDNNGISIISKGVAKDKSESSKDLHLVFLIKNNNSANLYLRIKDNSFKVNDFLIDKPYFYGYIEAGKAKVIDVEIDEDELKKLKINDIVDIKKVETVINVTDENGKEIDGINLILNYD